MVRISSIRVTEPTLDTFNTVRRESSVEQRRDISADEMVNILVVVYRAEQIKTKGKSHA